MVDEVSLDEAWETESGLLDSYTGTVKSSYFATDARYQDGNVILLHWVIETNSPEFPEVTEKFPVGGGWDSSDGGKTVVHEQGKQKFHKSSIYGRIVERVTKPDGKLHEMFPILKGRGRPTSAAIWEGLTFDFKREEFNYGGDIGTKERVMPVKFLGQNAQPTLGTNVTTSAPAAAPATTETPALDLDPVVKAKLDVAAKGAENHGAFLDAAMAIDGVVTNEALMAALVDDGPSGYFATARA